MTRTDDHLWQRIVELSVLAGQQANQIRQLDARLSLLESRVRDGDRRQGDRRKGWRMR